MPMIAMHMNNELLTPAVAIGFMVPAGLVLSLASRKVGAVFDPAKVPLMGVLGAFVFAAQMINFPILPGTSGHLGGGVLLAILLGPHAATLVMASILIVQCLIFQDGGILALGTNICNIGIVPCYLGHLLFQTIAGSSPSAARLYAGVFFATLMGMTAGAAMVPVETALSGVLAVPFSRFLLVMVGLHLFIAFVEAVITFGVVTYIVRVRPQLLPWHVERLPTVSRLSTPMLAGSLLLIALLLGGIGSLFASSWPDALDSLTASYVRENASPTIAAASRWQEQAAPIPDYQWKTLSDWAGTSAGGVLGTLITLGVVWAIGRWLR